MFLLLSVVLFASSAFQVDAVLQEGTEGVCVQTRTEPYTEYESRQYSESRKEWCWDITKAFRCNVIYPRWEQVPVYRVREVRFLVCCDGWWFVDGFCKRLTPVHEESPIVVVPDETPAGEVAPSVVDEHTHEEVPIVVVPAQTPVAEEQPPGADEHAHEEEEIPVAEQTHVVEEHQEVPIVVVPVDTPTVEAAPLEHEHDRTAPPAAENPVDSAFPSSHPSNFLPSAPDTEASMADLELAQTLFRALSRDSQPPVDEQPVHPSKVFEEFIETPEQTEPTDEPEPEMFPMNNESDEQEFPVEEFENHWREIIKHLGKPEEQRPHVETANDEEQQNHEHEETAPIDQRFVEHWRELINHIANVPIGQQPEGEPEGNDQQHHNEDHAVPAHTDTEQQPEPHWREIIKHIVVNQPVVHEEEPEQPEEMHEKDAAAAAAHAAEEAAASAAAEAAHRAHEGAKAEQMAAEIAGIFVKELINSLPQEPNAPANPEPSVEHGSEPSVPNKDHSPEPEPLAPSLPEVQKVLEDTMEDLSETMFRSLSRLHRAWASIRPVHSGTHDRLETRA